MSDETSSSAAVAESSDAGQQSGQAAPIVESEFLESSAPTQATADDTWIFKPTDEVEAEVEAASGVETEETTETTETTEGEQAKPVFDEVLLGIAEKLGFTREDAQQFPNPRALFNACDRIVRANRAAPDSQAQNVGPSVPEQAQHQLPDLGLDPNEVAPEIIQAFERQQQFFQSQLSARDQQLEQLQYHAQAEQERKQIESDRQFDVTMEDWFARLQDHSEIVGKGTFESLKPAQKQARLEMADMYLAIESRYHATGRPVPSAADIQRMAEGAVLSSHIEKNAARKEKERISQQLRSRNGQFVSRPTPKKVDQSMTPEQRAVMAVGEKMAAMGFE